MDDGPLYCIIFKIDRTHLLNVSIRMIYMKNPICIRYKLEVQHFYICVVLARKFDYSIRWMLHRLRTCFPRRKQQFRGFFAAGRREPFFSTFRCFDLFFLNRPCFTWLIKLDNLGTQSRVKLSCLANEFCVTVQADPETAGASTLQQVTTCEPFIFQLLQDYALTL